MKLKLRNPFKKDQRGQEIYDLLTTQDVATAKATYESLSDEDKEHYLAWITWRDNLEFITSPYVMFTSGAIFGMIVSSLGGVTALWGMNGPYDEEDLEDPDTTM